LLKRVSSLVCCCSSLLTGSSSVMTEAAPDVTPQATSADTHGQPSPVLILKLTEEGCEVDEDALELIHKNLKASKADKVSIISVMGEFRTGKSFVLGFILRFLKKKLRFENERREAHVMKRKPVDADADYEDIHDDSDDDEADEAHELPVLEDYNELKGKLYANRSEAWKFCSDDRSKDPLPPWVTEGDSERLKSEENNGFIWRHGRERCTTGIWIWSEPFTFTNAQGQRVGVLLMDTQGAWDSRMTAAQSGSIFGISALLSSKLIYNMPMHITEAHFDNLDYITTFTQSVCSDINKPGTKPFGHLQCLVRDWPNYDEDFTMEACCKQMAEDLSSHLEDSSSPEKSARLKDVFKSIKCFGLCDPGPKVKQSKFDGSLSAIDKDWFTLLDEFMRQFFTEDFPVASSPLGNDLTVETFKSILLNFSKAFESKSSDLAVGLRQAFVENNVVAVRDRLTKEFKAQLAQIAPEGSVTYPERLEQFGVSQLPEYMNKFTMELAPYNLEETQQAQILGDFKHAVFTELKIRKAFNDEALSGANLKIVASPVVGGGLYFLSIHTWLAAIVAGGGGYWQFQKKSKELGKEFYDTDVVKGVIADDKAFMQKRYRDVQAMQVVLQTCNPNDTMDSLVRQGRQAAAVAGAAGAMGGVNAGGVNAGTNEIGKLHK